jgi:hypothetical protein
MNRLSQAGGALIALGVGFVVGGFLVMGRGPAGQYERVVVASSFESGYAWELSAYRDAKGGICGDLKIPALSTPLSTFCWSARSSDIQEGTHQIYQPPLTAVYGTVPPASSTVSITPRGEDSVAPVTVFRAPPELRFDGKFFVWIRTATPELAVIEALDDRGFTVARYEIPAVPRPPANPDDEIGPPANPDDEIGTN